jgi:hypothetical protein
MAKRKKTADEVEWLDEHLLGHSSARRWEVEVRVSGSVVIDGTEYILDEVVRVPVDECQIKAE